MRTAHGPPVRPTMPAPPARAARRSPPSPRPANSTTRGWLRSREARVAAPPPARSSPRPPSRDPTETRTSHTQSSLQINHFSPHDAAADVHSGGMRRTLGPLLCELHAHTRWSDGELTVAELVDLHGRSGFDVLCVTDHVVRSDDPWRFEEGLRFSAIEEATFPLYLAEIEREAARAWR